MRTPPAVLLSILALAGALAPAPARAMEAKDAVRDAIAGRLSVPTADVEVGALGLAEGIPTDRDWTVELPSYGSFSGRVSVTLQSAENGRPVRLRVSPTVLVWREIPVAAQATRPGNEVPIRLERVRSDLLKGEVPVDPRKSWEASTSLVAGQPVTQGRVRPVPDKREGSEVTLIVERGAVRIAAPGQLVDDAFVGQTVHVTNLATRSVLVGTWTAGGFVLIGGS